MLTPDQINTIHRLHWAEQWPLRATFDRNLKEHHFRGGVYDFPQLLAKRNSEQEYFEKEILPDVRTERFNHARIPVKQPVLAGIGEIERRGQQDRTATGLIADMHLLDGFLENARAKALAYAALSGGVTLAEKLGRR